MSDDASRRSPEDEHWERLARYLAGECSADEEDAVRRYLLEDPAQAALFRLLADPTLARAHAREVDVEGALRAVRARRQAFAGRRLRPFLTWPRAGVLAAAAVVAIVAGTLLVRATLGSRVDAPRIAARTFASPVGARDSLALPDGSRVLLGPGTVLSLAADYGARTREVTLAGEAYFDVRHDAARPFTVHAGSATIRDVGTRFSVHDDVSGEVRVAVTRGAVLLRSAAPGDRGLVLRGGDAGMVTGGAPALARAGGLTPEDLAWTRGQLVFRDAPLDDVAADLHRWYGVQLLVPDPALVHRHLTATFNGDAVQHVVQVIALALGAEAEWHGDTAVMRR